MDLTNISIPKNYKIVSQYEYREYRYDNNLEVFTFPIEAKYITNSKNINNPSAGDIRISFRNLYSQYKYYTGLVKLENNYIMPYEVAGSYSQLFVNSDSYDNADVLCNLLFIIIKILFVVVSVILLFGFGLLLFGLSRLEFIQRKFGQVKKYKIVLLSIILGSIMTLLLIILI